MLQDVAPVGLIRKDFDSLRNREKLDTTKDVEEVIFIQSMEGRAHNGAGHFRRRYYVNTTIDDVVHALGRRPAEVKSRRQDLIDDIVNYARGVIEGRDGKRLVTPDGKPFLGIPAFKTREVDPREVLKGLYLGGLRDNCDTRRAAEEKYGTRIGFGKCYLVNIDVMQNLGLNGESLAHKGHEEEIEFFKQKGLIAAPEDIERIGEERVRYMYIRHREGPGQSDDAAIVAAGLLYNVDVALGVFLSDAIDTLEKYVLEYRDQDDELAFYIQKNLSDLAVSEEEIHELTYISAIPEELEETTPDSSLRYLLAVDEETNQTALESHLNFVEKKPLYPVYIGYNRIPSPDFYRYMKNRILAVTRVAVPVEVEVLAKEGEKEVAEVMDQKFITVTVGTPLKEALARARRMQSDSIVVQDEEGRILGVIDTPDYIHLLKGAMKRK